MSALLLCPFRVEKGSAHDGLCSPRIVLPLLEHLTDRNLTFAAYALLGLLIISTQLVLLPFPVQAVAYAGSALYIGAHRSLSMFDRDPDTGDAPLVESMQSGDALLLPAALLGVLLSLYLAFRFLGNRWVSLLLSTYFSLTAVAALAESGRTLLVLLLPEGWRRRTMELDVGFAALHRVWGALAAARLVDCQAPSFKLRWTQVRVVAYGVAGIAMVACLYSGSRTLNNLFVISFALQALALVSLGRFTVGLLLLGSLFAYDGCCALASTGREVAAARFQCPVEVILPRSWDPWEQRTLSLGDIVVPGVFVAMCLRLDVHNHHKNHCDEAIEDLGSVPKPYFWWTCCTYLAALLLSGAFMADTALLYLVPGPAVALLGRSYLRGELEEVLAYSEEQLLPGKVDESNKDK